MHVCASLCWILQALQCGDVNVLVQIVTELCSVYYNLGVEKLSSVTVAAWSWSLRSTGFEFWCQQMYMLRYLAVISAILLLTSPVAVSSSHQGDILLKFVSMFILICFLVTTFLRLQSSGCCRLCLYAIERVLVLVPSPNEYGGRPAIANKALTELEISSNCCGFNSFGLNGAEVLPTILVFNF